jgi:GxxExxY protein
MLRVRSPLTPAEETIVNKTIGCGIEVHRVLGPGFRERIYERAFALELESRGLKFECEKAIDVPYKEWKIPGQRIDLVVEQIVIVEIKIAPRIKQLHRRQLVSYLRSTGLPVGLLMNFNTTILKNGLVRVVNSTDNASSRSS